MAVYSIVSEDLSQFEFKKKIGLKFIFIYYKLHGEVAEMSIA